MTGLRRHVGTAWVFLLVVLMLGPALGPGFLLSYDMVWVPDLRVRSDFFGVGSALPRAVPSDLVVAVLDELIPGMVLQKIVLASALVVAGLGAKRLAPPGSAVGQVAAATAYLCNPFVVERFVLGHWTVLLAHAALPWLWLAGRRWRRERRLPWWGWWALPVASLSASAGVVAAVTLLVSGWRGRRDWVLLGAVAAANAPWLVAGLLHVGSATSTGEGGVFGLSDEGVMPAPIAALTLGGIWNAEVVPASRLGLAPVVATVLLVICAPAGWRALRSTHGRGALSLLVLWVIGFSGACLTWLAPDVVGWWASTVPGGGLLRDGGRLVGLCAPLTAGLVGGAAAALAERVRHVAARSLVGVAACLLPVLLLPEAIWGFGGGVGPVALPEGLRFLDAAVGKAERSGDVLVLPLSSYRAPTWNDRRKVLDPVGRAQARNFVASDRLSVSGVELPGEDARVERAFEALARPTPQERADALADVGVGLLVRDLTAPRSPRHDAEVAGTVVHSADGYEVVSLASETTVRRVPWGWWWAVVPAWTAFVLVPALGVLSAMVRRRRSRVPSAGSRG